MPHSEFAVHILNDEGIEKANEIRNLFDTFLTSLEIVCQPNRGFSITKTKLEEACFFAKKSMATNLINQK